MAGGGVTLLSEAQSQLAARKAAADAADETARQAFRTAATDAIRQVLKREDGTLLTLAQAGLNTQAAVLDVNVREKRLVVSDGSVALAITQPGGGAWVVHVVWLDAGQYTNMGKAPVASLADIAARMVG